MKQDLYLHIYDLLPLIVESAQHTVDGWEQDDEGFSEEFGYGGICDRVADSIGNILTENNIYFVYGGHDGDDHAYVIAYDQEDRTAFLIDIDPYAYEEGHGYVWKKRDGVELKIDDVIIEEVLFSDIEESLEL